MHPDLSLLSVTEHQRALQAEARRDRLAALTRCCRPTVLRAAITTAATAALAALRPVRQTACCA